jgi:hypothetical protein
MTPFPFTLPIDYNYFDNQLYHKTKIICKKRVTCKKKQGDFNFALLGDKDCLHWIWPVKKMTPFPFTFP